MKSPKVFFLTVMLLLTSHTLNAYEVDTHEDITEKSFELALEKRDFLKDIGFKYIDPIKVKDTLCDPEDGLDICFDVSKSILEWVRLGSRREDAYFSDLALFRFRQHFYDPVNERGYEYSGVPDGKKAYLWALESGGEIFGQRYSLEDAKKYYEIGLTAESKDKRDTYLAKTFRTLGHVVHLVQDMAQPQHTRNDSHGGFFGLASGPQWLG